MGIQAKRHKGHKGKPQPITRHPLFPVLVALWFGALFGLGSLAVRIGLIEALVLKLRVDQVLSFAAPPLGMKARILIALAMAVTGALIGLWLGRRLRDGGTGKAAGGSAGLAASLKRAVGREEPAPAGRRRALSVGAERKNVWPGDLAPLPGDRPKVLSASDYDYIAPLPESGETVEDAPPPAPTRDACAPLDLDRFAAGEEDEALPRPFDAPIAQPAHEPQHAFAAPQVEEAIVPDAEVEAPAEPAFAPDAPLQQVAEPAPLAASPAAPDARGEAGMTHLDLVNQLAEAMKARRERLAAARAAVPVEQLQADAAPDPAFPTPVFEPVAFEPVTFEPVSPVSDEPEAVAPVSLPRLGQSPVPDTPGAAPLPQMPAALRPLTFDDDDEADLDTSHVPPRSIGLSPVEPASDPVAQEAEADLAEDEPVGATDEALEDGYSSLLDLSRPAQPRQSFIRIEDPEAGMAVAEPEPVVIFPGQAPRPFDAPAPAAASMPEVAPAAAVPEPQAEAPAAQADRPFAAPSPASIPAVLADREETERALRTALATLQRMSGAA